MKKKSISQKEMIKNNLKKPEFWIGLITILVAVIITGILTARFVNKMVTTISDNQKVISPVPTTLVKTSITLPPAVNPTETKKQPLTSRIKKLAETGYIQETVLENDSYWTISQRACGTGVYYLNIQDLNNQLNPNDYDGLQKGEIIIVECK